MRYFKFKIMDGIRNMRTLKFMTTDLKFQAF